MVEVYSDPALDKDSRTVHGFSGRFSRDDHGKQTQIENRTLFFETLDVPAQNFVKLVQTHSSHCRTVSAGTYGRVHEQEGDALITKEPGLVLTISTADCGPVLFTGETEGGVPVIGAAHAGWRGALHGILDNTFRAMTECGARPDAIKAAIGPCIHQEHYEIGPEFYERFITRDSSNKAFFQNGSRAGHHLFDLPGYLENRLISLGCGQVSRAVCQDTYGHPDYFFSYRRNTHHGKGHCGHQISAIMIRNQSG